MKDFLEIKRIEQNYRWIHNDLFPIMNIAGTKVAEDIRKKYGDHRKILFLCGHGNNGADGLIAAKDLSSDNDVRVLHFTDSKGNVSTLSRTALELSRQLNVEKNPDKGTIERECEWAEVIIDAVLGTGLSGELREPYRKVVDIVNRSGKDVVSVDVPTGFGTDLHIKAKQTVTFLDKKPGMNRSNSGIIHIENIGLGPESMDYTGAGEMVYFPRLKDDGHKGDNGRLHVIAGWTYPGAGFMSASAAGASLTDLISISVPDNLYSIFSSRFTGEIVVRSSTKEEESLIEKASTILIGPGLGQNAQNIKMLERTLKLKKRFVLDADALRMASKFPELLPRDSILTPHSGEFEQLTGTKAVKENVIDFARKYKVIIILKGKEDIITDGDRLIRSRGGNPRLAMGGTGDMLAGLAAGFLSRGMPSLQAANLASFINKYNAQRVFEKKSYWFSVGDLLSEMNSTMSEIQKFID